MLPIAFRVVIAALLVSPLAPPTVAQEPLGLPDACGAAVSRGCEAWTDFRDDGRESVNDMATSPDGAHVYTLVNVDATVPLQPILTAYTSAGDVDWRTALPGPPGIGIEGYALAVSPDSNRIYMTGVYRDYSWRILTVAFDAATGEPVWNSVHPAFSYPQAIALSPDGSHVYVAGTRTRVTNDYVTLAYEAATGDLEWATYYDGGGPGDGFGAVGDMAEGLAVSPDGTRVFVTGTSTRPAGGLTDALTIAYDATNGATSWVRREAQATSLAGQTVFDSSSTGYRVAVHPQGDLVYVLGTSGLMAYRADTGERAWVPENRAWCREGWSSWGAGSCTLLVSPDGASLYLRSSAAVSSHDALTGELRWWRDTRIDSDPALASHMALSPDGTRVYVTLTSGAVSDDINGYVGGDIETIALDTAEGVPLWRVLADYGKDSPERIAVAPEGDQVYVLSLSAPKGHPPQVVMLAYSTNLGLAPYFPSR